MVEEKIVYATPRRRCYHTDPECVQLGRSDRVFEKERRHFPDLSECKVCSGDHGGRTSPDPLKRVRLLEEMDPNEV